MGRTHQRPLLADLAHTSTKELPESSGLLDLTDDRLGECLAPRVDLSSATRPKRACHPLSQRHVLGWTSARSGRDATMFLLSGRDEGFDPFALECPNVFFRPVSSVCDHRFGLGVQRRFDRSNRGPELVDVRGSRCHVLRDDHLKQIVDRDLGVIALDESVAGLLDPRLRIGEVPLGPVLRLRAPPWPHGSF